jgi:hypothetical protein
MTADERAQIASLSASFEAFLDRYDRDQAEARDYRVNLMATAKNLDERVTSFEHLRSKAGGVVLAVGFVASAVLAVGAYAWKWIASQVFGIAA